ncbi:hypothetical protein PZ895_00580, partial [Mesorhizobium sp. YIM 152430]|nr:hypothetical protein [Mesorhizobium sp. YIM 152430]
LAVWFGLHVVFEEVGTITTFGLDLDVPVWSSINLAAAALVLAALVAVFRGTSFARLMVVLERRGAADT